MATDDVTFSETLDSLLRDALSGIADALREVGVDEVSCFVDDRRNGRFFELDDPAGLDPDMQARIDRGLACLSQLLHGEYYASSCLVVTSAGVAILDGEAVLPEHRDEVVERNASEQAYRGGRDPRRLHRALARARGEIEDPASSAVGMRAALRGETHGVALDRLVRECLDRIASVLRRVGVNEASGGVDDWDNGWFLTPDTDGTLLDDTAIGELEHELATLSRLLHGEYTLDSTLTITAAGNSALDDVSVLPPQA